MEFLNLLQMFLTKLNINLFKWKTIENSFRDFFNFHRLRDGVARRSARKFTFDDSNCAFFYDYFFFRAPESVATSFVELYFFYRCAFVCAVRVYSKCPVCWRGFTIMLRGVEGDGFDVLCGYVRDGVEKGPR